MIELVGGLLSAIVFAFNGAVIIGVIMARGQWKLMEEKTKLQKHHDQLKNSYASLDYKTVRLEQEIRLLRAKIKSQAIGEGQFTKDELKKMRHYLHPDKHSGKTESLFIKVNKHLGG